MHISLRRQRLRCETRKEWLEKKSPACLFHPTALTADGITRATLVGKVGDIALRVTRGVAAGQCYMPGVMGAAGLGKQ